jgi:putative spermidine/putrescine transport system ATP-binding protein
MIFEGERVVYTVELQELEGLTLRVFDHDPSSHAEHKVGAPVILGWNARDLFVYPS